MKQKLSEITIRPAVREELRETALIYLECLREDYACKPQVYLDTRNVEEELAECEQWMYRQGLPNQIFVAIDGGIMAGYIAVGPNVGQLTEYEGEVCGLFLRKSYRKRGIGLRLLQAGMHYLRKLGYQKIVIYNYHISEANQYYRWLGGQVVWQEIQTTGGMAFETDVFGYEINVLLATLGQRLEKYG